VCSGLGSNCALGFLFLSQLELLEPGKSGVASCVVDVILSSNDLLTESIVHTSRLLLPPRCLSLSPPGSLCWSPLLLGNTLCWELAELLLLLRGWRKPLWLLRCGPLPLRLRGGLEALGLRGSLLWLSTWRRGVRLELAEGLPLLGAELLLLDGKVLLVNLDMAPVSVLLVSCGPE